MQRRIAAADQFQALKQENGQVDGHQNKYQLGSQQGAPVIRPSEPTLIGSRQGFGVNGYGYHPTGEYQDEQIAKHRHNVLQAADLPSKPVSPRRDREVDGRDEDEAPQRE